MRQQQGTTTVEFAFVGLIFLTMLLASIEVGRGMYVSNTLEEVTRRGARVAAVCPINHPDVVRTAVFAGAGSTAGGSPVLYGLDAGNIQVEYLSENGLPAGGYDDARFVRVEVSNYSYPLIYPFGTIDMGTYSTTIPTESLGYVPELDMRTCFGS